MREYKVLNALGMSRETYEQGRSFVPKDILSPLGSLVLQRIDEYYGLDEKAEAVDFGLIEDSMVKTVEQVPKHKAAYQDYFTVMRANADNVSELNILKELRDAVLLEREHKLADAILAKDSGTKAKLYKEIQALLESDEITSQEEEAYSDADVSVLVNAFDDTNRMAIAPAALNARLNGGLRRGHHLLLAARPEVGKSMFSISIAAGLVRQGYRVLYIINEDPVPDIMMRFVSSLTDMNEDEILADPTKAMSVARDHGYGNATFVGMAPGTIDAISAIARRYEPDAIIIDQLRNIASGKSENNTARLDEVARGARNLGRKHNCCVISVTQAGDSAEGKLNLTMSDVDGSKTGVPGATDVMVMVGCNDAYREKNLRVLSFPKNKVGRDRSELVVRVMPEISRVYTDPHLNTPKVEDRF